MPSDLKKHQKYICADMRRTMPTQKGQNSPNETNREEAGSDERKQQGSYETSKPGPTAAEAIRAPTSSEMKETITDITEEETTTTQTGNNHRVSGRPRQPKESGGNDKGTLRYEAETMTWQCTQCDKKYAEKGAWRAEASHVETHSGTNQKIRRQQEQQILQENAYQNSDKTRLRAPSAIWARNTRSVKENQTPWDFTTPKEQKKKPPGQKEEEQSQAGQDRRTRRTVNTGQGTMTTRGQTKKKKKAITGDRGRNKTNHMQPKKKKMSHQQKRNQATSTIHRKKSLRENKKTSLTKKA